MATSAVVASTEHPLVIRWRRTFADDPVNALSEALSGRISLGPYDQNRSADALAQILTENELRPADEALAHWLRSILGCPTPQGITAKRFSESLIEAFRLITILELSGSRAWCVENHGPLRKWLRSFFFGHSRDPEAALLVALAHNQRNRALLNLWATIVRRGHPVSNVRHALTGLRLMPADDNGAVERGVSRALLRGLLDFGEALARHRDQDGAIWLQEIDYLSSVYPMSKEQWARRFREVIRLREPSATVQKWLEQRYPAAFKDSAIKTANQLKLPKHVDDLKALLQKIPNRYEAVRPQLVRFFEDHRRYCRESGDTYYLVRTFCFAGERLLDTDPGWVRELAHEAAIWEPNNHYPWSLLARALEQEGDWRRAEAVYWQARRRFPEISHSHDQLAHALLVHGNADLGEAVYREGINLFPEDSVGWSDLAHTLRVTGRLEDALAVYREASEKFNRNAVIANALADTLIDAGRLEEATRAIERARQIVPHDDVRNQEILARIRDRLQRVQAGQPLILKKLTPRPEISGAASLSVFADISGTDFSNATNLGRAAILRRKANGGLARAQELIQKLPESSERLIEYGLWLSVSEGWMSSAKWFDDVWKRYEGDGVLRVHRQRARARAGEHVDWSIERTQYPELIGVVLTEERGQPPRPAVADEQGELSHEQRQDIWFANLAGRKDRALIDHAEEHYLAARHQL